MTSASHLLLGGFFSYGVISIAKPVNIAAMDFWREFHGPNAGYILELYDRYRNDPNSVDAATRAAFEGWRPPEESNGRLPATPAVTAETDKVMGAINLAMAIREYGHLASKIDPLDLANPPGDPSLHPSAHGIRDADLRSLPASLIGGSAAEAANAYEAINRLREIYSSTIGYDKRRSTSDGHLGRENCRV